MSRYATTVSPPRPLFRFPDSKIVVDLSDVADSDGDVDTRTAKKSHNRSKSRSKEGREPDWTFAEIIRSPFFWTTVGADMAFKLFWAGTNLHNVDLFGIHGIDTNSVARLSLPFAVGTLCGVSYVKTVVLVYQPLRVQVWSACVRACVRESLSLACAGCAPS